MDQWLLPEEGGIGQLQHILEQRAIQKVFIITGAHFKQQNENKQLLTLPFHWYIKQGTNVDINEIAECYNEFLVSDADAIVVIGGGSAMDIAKAIIYKAAENEIKKSILFIAAPTTAGSGSEATRFAVIYKDKTKLSLEHDQLLPKIVILDPELTYSLSPRQTAVSGIDALAQAIESYWNVHATPVSLQYAAEAITILINDLPAVVNKPSPELRMKVLWASHLAGKAINTTRTTGPHALSYFLTAHYDIPHGQAVGLFLPLFFLYNDAVNDTNCNHTGGVAAVKKVLEQLYKLLNVQSSEEAASYIRSLMIKTRLASTFYELGINKKEAITPLLDKINEERFNNNPVALDRDLLMKLCKEYL